MVIAEHKTAKHYEAIVEALPADFVSILAESLKQFPRQFLFVNAKGGPFTNQSFSKWVISKTESMFGGKAPGVSLLRHAYCTDIDYNKLTGIQLDEIAARMGHSTDRQMEYRMVANEAIHKYNRGSNSFSS
jgi:site-specific recombinase XerD